MSFLSKPLYQGKLILCIIGYLILAILKILLLPIVFILPNRFIENFDDIIINATLKTLWFFWRVVRTCLLFTLTLVLFVLSPILWPIYLGIAFFWPGFVRKLLFETKLF